MRFLLPVAIAAFVLRVLLATHAGIIEHDGAIYAGLARALLAGDWYHGISTVWPPLEPLLITAAAYGARALGAAPGPALLELCARLISALAATLLVVPVYLWGRRLLGERHGRVAALLTAFHPRLIQYGTAALTEMPFTLLLVSGIALLAGGNARDRDAGAGGAALPPGRAALAGALVGLSYLARPEGVLLGGVAWLSAGAGGLARRGRGIRIAALAFPAALLVVAAPYLLFLHGALGRWSLGEKGPYNFWRAHRAAYALHFPEPAGLSERVFESPELNDDAPRTGVRVLGLIEREPVAVTRTTFGNLGRIVGSSMPLAVYPAFALFALIGAWRPPRSWRPVWVTVLVMPLLYAPFTADRRFFVPAVPLLLLLAARGVARIEGAIARRSAARARGVTVAIVVLLVVTGLAYAAHLGGGLDRAPEHRAAGEWLRAAWPGLAHGEPGGPIVMSRKPWVAFYAGGLVAELPDLPPDAVLERARRKHVDVIVVDARWGVATRPVLAPWLDPDRAPPGLRVLHVVEAPERLVLYDARGLREESR